MSDYETVGGGLKLKKSGAAAAGKKSLVFGCQSLIGHVDLDAIPRKKKKDTATKDKLERQLAEAPEMLAVKAPADLRTESEKRFAAIQQEREMERIAKKAVKSHKEKVQDLNQYLDKLSEHYDIPKVSWTK